MIFDCRARGSAKCWWRSGTGCHYHGWKDTWKWCGVLSEEHRQPRVTGAGRDGKGVVLNTWLLSLFKRKSTRPLTGRKALMWVLFINVSNDKRLCAMNWVVLPINENVMKYIFYFNFFLHGKCQTAHIMLTSTGANQFAESVGMVTVPTDTLVTEYERKEWEKHKNYVTGVMEDFNSQW